MDLPEFRAPKDPLPTSKWMCPTCDRLNFESLHGEECWDCKKKKPYHVPGIHKDFDTGAIYWQCAVCFTRNGVENWSDMKAATCVKCSNINVVAKRRVDAKKKEIYYEWVRERNALCEKCGKKEYKRHG